MARTKQTTGTSPSKSERDLAGVDAFMGRLKHPLKAEIEKVRGIIARSSPKLSQRVKWNAPSFHYVADMMAFHLRTQDVVHLIFIFPPGMKVIERIGWMTGDHKDRREIKIAPREVANVTRPLRGVVQEWVRRMDDLATPAPPPQSTRRSIPARTHLVAAAPGLLRPYAWDDANPHLVFAREPAICKRIAKLQPRLALAFAAACAEWIAWTFRERHELSFIDDLIDAVWVATANHQELVKPSLARRIKPAQWSGKDRRPIFITYDHLLAASCGIEGTGDPTEVVYHLASLARHVVPNQRAFSRWRNGVLARFERLSAEGPASYPLPPASADLSVEFGRTDAKRLYSRFLKTVDRKANVYLA